MAQGREFVVRVTRRGRWWLSLKKLAVQQGQKARSKDAAGPLDGEWQRQTPAGIRWVPGPGLLPTAHLPTDPHRGCRGGPDGSGDTALLT